MTDPRFFRRSGPFTLAERVQGIGAEPADDESGRLMVHDIAAVEAAGPHEVTVFNDAGYRSALAGSRAGAIVTSRDLARQASNGNRLLIVAEPRLAYAQIGHLFYPAPALVPGIAASADIHPTATIGAGSQIEPGAHIGRDVVIGAGCYIGPHVALGAGVVRGDGGVMGGEVGVSDHLPIGPRARIAAKSGVMRDVPPGVTVGGFPAMEIKQWHRQTTGLARLLRPQKNEN